MYDDKPNFDSPRFQLHPTPAYACLYCPAVFTSPNARLHHLEEAHNEVVDTSGAAAAVMHLQAVLAATANKHKALLKKRGEAS